MFSEWLSGSLLGSRTERGNTYLMSCVNCFSTESIQYFHSVKTGVYKFSKIQEPVQNYRHKIGYIKQVPYLGSKNIRCHHTKFNRPGDLAPGLCAPLGKERKKGFLRGLVRVDPDFNWLALTNVFCFSCGATAQLGLRPPHC